MVSKTTFLSTKREKNKKDRPDVHAKTKSSGLKSSKNYRKKYVGQGRT